MKQNRWLAMNPSDRLPSDRSIVWFLLAMVMVTGCRQSDQPGEETHEHFPPHWPQTIFQASARLNEFAEKEEPTSTHHQIPSRQELIDLVGWLPILVADSDLDRETFDRIDAEATKIAARWERADASHNTRALINEPGVRELIQMLAEVCQREQSRIDRLEQQDGIQER